MDEQTNAAAAGEGRREFFKTVARGLILGGTAAGAAWMVHRGKIDLSECIDEKGPCARCPRITGGCELPKAEAHRRSGPHGGT